MNPFTDYLPMYPPDTLPDRPWWRFVQDPCGTGWILLRIDGARITALVDLDVRFALQTTVSEAVRAAALADLDAYDAAHPLPCPRPMVGQVWRRGDGLIRMVTEIDPDSEIDGHDLVVFGAHRVMIARAGVTAMPGTQIWPPAYAILVLGPTPWGRDRPWAPAGWRP